MNLDISTILTHYGIEHVKEYRFHPTRKWRFDFAIPEQRIAIEFEGGIFSGGRHTRGKGYANDCEKYNSATTNGWRVLRYTADMLRAEPLQVARDVYALILRKP